MTTHESLGDWERAYARRVVDAINQIRGRLGLSIPALRTRLSEVGWDMGLDTLNGILSSKKRKAFTVGETLCFASALRVPPEFLLLGMPLASELPTSPFAPRASVPDALHWFRGTPDSVYEGSVLQAMERQARTLDDLRRENAIWEITGEPRLWERGTTREEVPAVHQLLDLLRTDRQRWRAELERGAMVPELPELPSSVTQIVDSGAPMPTEPLRDLLDARTIDVVRSDLDRWERAGRMRAKFDDTSTHASE
ncbi:hypothetical protein [Microbacterium testaceum]|uniref:hypothetical protein n=1 Tax=Microbacterium testaceum TaxID=2033 RepID=UPI0022E5FBDF|nr:hypothetical protein [Microbacterium testaceum]